MNLRKTFAVSIKDERMSQLGFFAVCLRSPLWWNKANWKSISTKCLAWKISLPVWSLERRIVMGVGASRKLSMHQPFLFSRRIEVQWFWSVRLHLWLEKPILALSRAQFLRLKLSINRFLDTPLEKWPCRSSAMRRRFWCEPCTWPDSEKVCWPHHPWL